MFKFIGGGFLMVLFLGGILGCATNGTGVHIRSYIQEKERVDQEMGGNAGYLTGQSQETTTEKKKTRKVYVVEFSKEADIPPQTSPQAVSEDSSQGETQENLGGEYGLNGDYPQAEKAVTVPESSFVEYKVEKDDTLQKISKKFYNSYSQWPKIYEANKAKIKDPNHIKPGIVLDIPVE